MYVKHHLRHVFYVTPSSRQTMYMDYHYDESSRKCNILCYYKEIQTFTDLCPIEGDTKEWVPALKVVQYVSAVHYRVKSVVLLGLGCSKTSVCFIILSVHCLVFSALTKRFSRWASNSVFSAWPNFSSVN